ncbi:MAG TPA: hypothetical protein ACFCUD_13280 [Cyclobacteriaceae bacterium]
MNSLKPYGALSRCHYSPAGPLPISGSDRPLHRGRRAAAIQNVSPGPIGAVKLWSCIQQYDRYLHTSSGLKV